MDGGKIMAIVQFTEPDINLFFDDLNQAVVLNNKASFVGKGYFSAMLSNINTIQAPVLLAGSMFEANGVLFFSDGDTAVSGSCSNGVVNYIYAAPDGLLQYSAATPAWNNIKGGWYSGNNRALAKFYYSSSGPVYGGKVMLDGYNAMQMMNLSFTASSGGNLVITGEINQVLAATLAAGQYRFEMQAGTGGNGSSGANGYGGGAGALGEPKSGTFILYHAMEIHYGLGGDGNNGGGGGYAGGGGGCTGGSAFIDIGYAMFLCIGGSGGGGGGNNGGGGGGSYGVGGGGGAGGYGSGSGGSGSSGGKGGRDGIGGNGGGGSYYGGGGGVGSSGSGDGYGIGGGNGGDGSSRYGGRGGGSKIGEGFANATDKYDRGIQFQGGGGGGGGRATSGSDSEGGAGGSGLKSTSSGYLNIYRLS
jgi:hypothetical protein